MKKESPSFRSILVPLDGSKLAEQALPIAARIAERTGGKLRLTLVHQPTYAPLDVVAPKAIVSMELAVRKSERGYLRSMQAKLREGGVRLSSAVSLTGEVGPAIATHVRELDIDLVVMATHGRGGVRRAWLGSVADFLIHHLEVPVLLVRATEDGAAPQTQMGSQILVALDGSPLAEEVLNTAAALARAWNLELTLLQVVQPVMLSSDPVFPVPTQYDEELTALSREQAQDYLDSLADGLRDEGMRVTAVSVIGWNPAGAILDLAVPRTTALVALATHGRGGLRRFVLGSVADKLVRGADVPVLVVRPAGRGKRKEPSAMRRRSGVR